MLHHYEGWTELAETMEFFSVGKSGLAIMITSLYSRDLAKSQKSLLNKWNYCLNYSQYQRVLVLTGQGQIPSIMEI